MDEFARMMSMEGVRPLDTSGNKFRRVVNRPSPVPSQPSGPPSNWSRAAMHGLPENVREHRLRQLWSALPARSALDDVAGQPVFYRMEGRLPASSGAASLLGTADRQSLRLIIVGGEGWTLVMHPLMGVATLDDDPA